MKLAPATKLSTAVLVILLGALWIAGAWEEASPRYWRIYSQSAQFFVAERLPTSQDWNDRRSQAVRSALLTHQSGLTDDELKLAASLLEHSGARDEAANLLMVLVRRDSDGEARKSHAERAWTLSGSRTAVLNLIALNRSNQDGRTRWASQLRTRFPAEPIGSALRCLDEYYDLARTPPHVCAAVDWANGLAQKFHREHLRLTQAIVNYEAASAEEIGKLQVEADRYLQDALQDRYELASVEQEASQQGWLAAGEFILNLLPWPKDGDTAESFVVREGLCAAKWINWLCAADSAGQALSRMEQRKAALAVRAKDLVESIRRDDWLAQYDLRQIQEWQSGEKLEDFKSSLRYQRQWFWRELDNEVFARMPAVGRDFDEVMREVAEGAASPSSPW